VLRLRDRRGRQRRLRPGQPPDRGPGDHGPAHRGRPAGHGRLHPHPRRLQRALPLAQRLGLHDGLRARGGRPAHLPAARQDARRVVVDERDDLHPRQPPRLGRVGRRGLRGLGVGRDPALLQEGRGQRARAERAARGRRARARVGLPAPQRALPGVPRRRGCGRDPGDGRLQRPRAGRRGLVPALHAGRQAGLDGGLLRASRGRPPEPHGGDARARDEGALRRHARGGGRRRTPRGAPDLPRREGGPGLRRGLQLPAAPHALGPRSRRGAHAPAGPARGRGPRHGPEPLRPPDGRRHLVRVRRRLAQGRPEPRQPRGVDGRRRPADLERGGGRRLPAHPRGPRRPRRPAALRGGDVRAGGPAAPARPRVHALGVRPAPALARPRGGRLARPADQAAHRPQLPRRSRGPALARRRGAARAGHRGPGPAGRPRLGPPHGPGRRVGRGRRAPRAPHDADDLPPRRDLQDGRRGRPDGRGGRRVPRARRRGPAGHRRLRLPDHPAREHERADDRARRAGRRPPARRRGARGRRRARRRL
ncbi:MAG: Oxidoreductase, GMC family, partial [uncultured Solirubrobacteraceae bacterium]